MNIIQKNLEKSVEDLLLYGKENATDLIVKTVFESIMQAERKEFLLNGEPGNKANGYYSRLFKSLNRYTQFQVPRDRNSQFKPLILELAQKSNEQMRELAFMLYTKGLSTRAVEQVLDKAFGKKMSASSISRITSDYQETRESWQQRPLEKEYYFLYIDALYVPIRRGSVEKEAVYVVLALKKDLTRDVIGLYNLPTESIEGWKTVVFEDLKRRGVEKVLGVIADGIQGMEKIVESYFPTSHFQKCLVHKIRRLLLRVRASDKQLLVADFNDVFRLDEHGFTESKGSEKLEQFVDKWRKKYPVIKNMFEKHHYKYYFAYTHFPCGMQRMINSTNWIERLNKEIRKTVRQRNSFPHPDSALNLIGSALILYEEEFYNKYKVTAFYPYKWDLDVLLNS